MWKILIGCGKRKTDVFQHAYSYGKKSLMCHENHSCGNWPTGKTDVVLRTTDVEHARKS